MKRTFLLICLIAVTVFVSGQKIPFTIQDAINVKSLSISDLTEDGKYIAGTIQSRTDRMNIDHKRFGDPNYVSPYTSQPVIINSETGETYPILNHSVIVRGLSFSPDDKVLAFLLYDNEQFNLHLFELASRKLKKIKLRSELKIASNSGLEWLPDGNGVILSFREKDWVATADSMFTEATTGPITVYDSERPFLKWDEISNFSSLSTIAIVDIKSGVVTNLFPEGSYSGLSVSAAGDLLSLIGYTPKKTVYDRKGGTDYELFMVDLKDPENKTTLIEKTDERISIRWNKDNTAYAFIDSNQVFVRSIYEDSARQISTDTTEVIKKDTTEVKFSVNRWSPDGQYVLASSKTGYWLIDADTKEMKLIFEFPEDKEKAPDKNIIDWSPDGNCLYMSYSAKDKWERGILRYDISSGVEQELLINDNLYSRWSMSEDGNRFFYQFSDGDQPFDLYVADPGFKEQKRLTNLNPWIEDRTLTRSELIKYRDADGKELNGILYYPVNYEPEKKYPLVCEIYENFFNNGYSMSMNIIANAGYFGFKPSVNLIQGYPGEAWIKGVTAGINKLIDMDLVDPEKLGVHGTSYGGYATSLLISQTDRFAAAINISGKTNIISFLGDSPRIGTRNYAAAEVGQDRIGESLWDAPMKYFATSAVLFADRINTPHLLLTGEADWNVPALNTREIYYAMRRLGEKAVWVNYYNGGHGAGASSNESDFYDHWNRILDWYETHFEKEETDKKTEN